MKQNQRDWLVSNFFKNFYLVTNPSLLGTRIGRVRVIFKLPKMLDTSLGPRDLPESWPQGPLAYIEWYSKLPTASKDYHGNMYVVKKAKPSQGDHISGAIIPLNNIRQSCMLMPLLSNEDVPLSWTRNNVLDLSSSFLLNNWLNKYSYQTLW